MADKITVVIPTYNRCEYLKRCLKSLENQTTPFDSYEVIVVIDGSTDSTIDFLESYHPHFQIIFFDQKKRGVSAARNWGWENANHNLILFLDDDVMAHPNLLQEHIRSHRNGQESLVQGALKVHRSVAETPFVWFVERSYLKEQRERESSKSELGCEDISSGNISLSKRVLWDMGGFDETFFRNTDGELAYRLEQKKIPLLYNPKSLAYLTHIKSFQESRDASFQYGRSYVMMHKKYPRSVWKHSPLVKDKRSYLRNLLRFFLFYFRFNKKIHKIVEPALDILTSISEIVGADALLSAMYRLSLDFFFWRGVHFEAGRDYRNYYPKKTAILCYHAVSEKKHKNYALYTVSTKRFANQMEWLKKMGYVTISLDELSDYLTKGNPLPNKSVVITFDDGYKEHRQTSLPLLAKRNFKHTHFINTGKTGATTDWVKRSPDLELLNAEEISEISQSHGGLIDFQAHGENHASLKKKEASFISGEITHCMEKLSELTRKKVDYLAYPYGDYDDQTLELASSLPLRCSFTVDQGRCAPGQHLHKLPRVEIFGNDFFIDFVFKVKFGWSPIASSRKILKRKYKKMRKKIIFTDPCPLTSAP